MNYANEVKALLEQRTELAWLQFEIQNLKKYLEENGLDPDETIVTGKQTFADTIENLQSVIISPMEHWEYNHYDALDLNIEVVVNAHPEADPRLTVNII